MEKFLNDSDVYAFAKTYLTPPIAEKFCKLFGEYLAETRSSSILEGHLNGHKSGLAAFNKQLHAEKQQAYEEGEGKGYELGEYDGYERGYREGYNIGYDDGYNRGETIGYLKGNEEGYRAGTRFEA